MNFTHESTPLPSSSSLRQADGLDVFNRLNPSLPVRLFQRCAGIPELESLYPRVESEQRPGESFYRALLRVLGVRWSISDLDLSRIPNTGASLLVANHPFGMIEGTVLGALLEDVRSDVRIMANSLMGHFPKVAEKCILVDPFGGEGSKQSNRKGMREAFDWLRRDGLLVVFPAGEVASFVAGKRIVTDPPWNTGIVRMATRVKAPVVPVFFDGSNGLGFQVAGILHNFGIKGFYTATLFSYHRAFIEHVDPALEMGRSFVRAEYQRSYAPLVLLWRGIGAYVRQNPHYKILFGPVSISNEYHPNSRELMVNFLKQYCRAEDLAHLVRARSPFRTRPIHRWENVLDKGMAWDIEELSTFIADIETDQKGVPVLLKQYLKLGGKLLGFNVDSHFSKALDGLIVVDLVKTDPRLLERYLGKAGAGAFLAYHQRQVAEAR